MEFLFLGNISKFQELSFTLHRGQSPDPCRTILLPGWFITVTWLVCAGYAGGAPPVKNKLELMEHLGWPRNIIVSTILVIQVYTCIMLDM